MDDAYYRVAKQLSVLRVPSDHADYQRWISDTADLLRNNFQERNTTICPTCNKPVEASKTEPLIATDTSDL